MRVVFLNQVNFPITSPFFDALFAKDGVGHRVMCLEIDEMLNVVELGEAGKRTSSMLVNTLSQVAGHADIKRSIWATGKDVNAGLLHS